MRLVFHAGPVCAGQHPAMVPGPATLHTVCSQARLHMDLNGIYDCCRTTLLDHSCPACACMRVHSCKLHNASRWLLTTCVGWYLFGMLVGGYGWLPALALSPVAVIRHFQGKCKAHPLPKPRPMFQATVLDQVQSSQRLWLHTRLLCAHLHGSGFVLMLQPETSKLNNIPASQSMHVTQTCSPETPLATQHDASPATCPIQPPHP